MSILSYLESLAGDALHLPAEKKKVGDATEKLASRLRAHFGDQIVGQFKFGSAVRGTNLPKRYAEDMDIDYLVVFRDRSLTPRTLIRNLLEFANSAYPRNDVYQSSPTVIIKLNAVRFELVPARNTLTGIFHTHEIPNSGATGWTGTNPLGFEANLVRRNNECHSKLKAAIRLVKIWNAENDYLYSSFRLENIAVDTYYPGDSNLRDYFCSLFFQLSEVELDAQWKIDRMIASRACMRKALELEATGKVALAERTLDKLFGIK